MFCHNCGTKVEEGSKFCYACGVPLQDTTLFTTMSGSNNTTSYSTPNSSELDWKWALFSFDGRINRQRYWTYWLLSIVFIIPLIVASRFSEGASFLLVIAMYGFGFTLGAKRWHDLNQTGWLAVLAVIPFVNLILGFIEGTKGDNQYGADIANL